MSSRRTIILVASIVLAALGVWALFSYVSGVEERSKPNPKPVFVISEEIKRGTPGTDVKNVSIRKALVPSEYLPDTYVADLGVLDGKVAVIDLKPNQILVDGMFVQGERLSTSFKDKITGDNVAVALSFDATRAVGGYIKPGDEVNLLLVNSIDDSGAGGDAPAAPAPATTRPTGTGGKAAIQQFRQNGTLFQKDVRYFYEKIKILAIGSETLRSPGETAAARPANGQGAAATAAEGPGGAGTIVFLVPPHVAQRLLAVDAGSLYMTLPSETWKPVPLAPIPVDEFDLNVQLPAEDPARLTPYGPVGYVDPTAVNRTSAPTTTAAAPPASAPTTRG